MAVAATIGGASPNFDGLYREVERLSKKLSVASPRDINDPGQKLQVTIVNTDDTTETYDTYTKAYQDKLSDDLVYMLYFKDGSGQEKQVSDGAYIVYDTDGVNKPLMTINGVRLAKGNTMEVGGQYTRTGGSVALPNYDIGSYSYTLNEPHGKIKCYDPDISATRDIGALKLDAVTGLDVAVINDRITQLNLVIEALNKVLTVANSNADKGIELRI